MNNKLIDKVIRCAYKDNTFPHAKKKEQYPDHFHDFYEIMILFKDNVSFVTEESIHYLYADHLIIIPPLKYHHVQVAENTDYKRLVLWFTVNDDENHAEFAQLLKNISVVNFSTNEMLVSAVHSFLELIKRCNKKHLNEITEAFITNLLFTIRHSNVVYEPQTKFNPIVYEVMGYLNSNLHKQNSLTEISKHFAISSSHLAKLFKSTMHISIINYVREKQLLQAKKDILDGKKPTSVYYHYGFNDYTCFYKSFKKRFGVSPNKIKVK